MNNTQSDPIAILMNEHKAVKERFGALLSAEGNQRAAILAEIKEMLAVHNATEENVIYPAVHSLADRPMHARTLYHEQDDAEVALWDLASLKPDDSEFVRKATELRDALLAHVKREEESEFKHLREDLSPEETRKMTAEFVAFRETLTHQKSNGSALTRR